MAEVVVVGAGMAGLATAVFAARRGHRVVLVERDAAAPEGSADEVFDSWHRPGVPQARHSHKFLGLSCRVLAQESPDILDELVHAGALRVPLNRFDTAPSHPDEFALAARRTVYEAVLRRAAVRESTVELLCGVAVRGVQCERRDGVPVVRGVRVDGDRTLRADLVVDASGRRAVVLRSVPGVRPPAPHVQHCGFVYLTRHYRLRPGRELPPLDRPLALNLGYAATLAFPADSGTFSLSVTLATQDPFRHALRRPQTWDRFVARVPHTARWAVNGYPHGAIHVMSGIQNRWQRLAGESGPALGGLVLVGDAAMQNNPTYGRGVSLAFAQAQHVARTAGSAADDLVGYVAAADEWGVGHLGVWHRTQTAADALALARMAAGLRGERLLGPTDPFSRLMASIEAMAAKDEVVARALGRMAHLLITPAQLFGDRDVVRRATAHLSQHPIDEPEAEGPSRAEFEKVAAA